ncbi:hypothetical protein ACFQS1_25375 [Paractinoplanes rhizophilus]|uniref:Uncharacterized protein n=1 Tax=Paractinoplanes rhizophilus TaxID=1416877 RepID=A0ABW2HYX8_9ACTN|nr:hypothetical protein [Actinoplanes sp.]
MNTSPAAAKAATPTAASSARRGEASGSQRIIRPVVATTPAAVATPTATTGRTGTAARNAARPVRQGSACNSSSHQMPTSGPVATYPITVRRAEPVASSPAKAWATWPGSPKEATAAVAA